MLEVVKSQEDAEPLDNYSLRVVDDSGVEGIDLAGFVLEPDIDLDLANPSSDFVSPGWLKRDARPRLLKSTGGIMAVAGGRELFSTRFVEAVGTSVVTDVRPVEGGSGSGVWNELSFVHSDNIIVPECFLPTRPAAITSHTYTPLLGVSIADRRVPRNCVVDSRRWGDFASRRVICLSARLAADLRARGANVSPVLTSGGEWGHALLELARWLAGHAAR